MSYRILLYCLRLSIKMFVETESMDISTINFFLLEHKKAPGKIQLSY